MWQIYEGKVIVLTRGDPISKRKQSKKFVVTTNDGKSAEAIVTKRYITHGEGLNLRR
jgi:hypothetical protein